MGLGKRQTSHLVSGQQADSEGTKREGNTTETEQPSYVGSSWGHPGVQRSPWSLFAELKRLPHPLIHLRAPATTPTSGFPEGGETAAAQEHVPWEVRLQEGNLCFA